MRGRRSSVIIALALAAPLGHASLEDDCYIEGGYFDAAYFGDDYLDETCAPADPPAVVTPAGGNQLFYFPSMMGT